MRRICWIWQRVWVAFYRECNIPLASHRNFKPYPTAADALCFHLVFHSVKVRLRASPSAQNDIQRCCVINIEKASRTSNDIRLADVVLFGAVPVIGVVSRFQILRRGSGIGKTVGRNRRSACSIGTICIPPTVRVCKGDIRQG